MNFWDFLLKLQIVLVNLNAYLVYLSLEMKLRELIYQWYGYINYERGVVASTKRTRTSRAKVQTTNFTNYQFKFDKLVGSMHVVSVNISKPETLQIKNKAVTTGIFKHPVCEKVTVNAQGLVGDTIANTAHHGGAD